MISPKILQLMALSQQVDASGDDYRSFKEAARALYDAPEHAAELLRLIAARAQPDEELEDMVRLLASGLDEARMARENGRQRGQAVIDALEDDLAGLAATTGRMTFTGRIALASSWRRAGLVPPDALATQLHPDDALEALDGDIADDMPDLNAVLSSMAEGSADAGEVLQSGLMDMLAALPDDMCRGLVRQVAKQPQAVFGAVACALLLERRTAVQEGAVEGLGDRVDDGFMTADLLSRLTVLRSWIVDPDLHGHVDAVIAKALRKGVDGESSRKPTKIHRVLASWIDGSGSQSVAASLQAGSSRNVAVLLLKQGFGVKDAYVVPCKSATEQRKLLDTIANNVDTMEVPAGFLAEVIAIALGDGLRSGNPPAPGLVDVVRATGLDTVRPLDSEVGSIVDRIVPEGTFDTLSPQARGRLINSSREWAQQHPMIPSSWFEDSDAFASALTNKSTVRSLKRALWSALEDRRAHWAAIIARSGLLLNAVGSPDATAFAAVALALTEGRDLKKVPIMETVFVSSLQVLADQHNFVRSAAPSDQDAMSGPELSPPTLPQLPMTAEPEKPRELETLLQPAGLTDPWINGYLAGVCTSPELVPPRVWLQHVLMLIMEEVEDPPNLDRSLQLLLGRYNETVGKLQTPVGVTLLPDEPAHLSIWADGFLTAWEGLSDFWPNGQLNAADGKARALLEAAAGFRPNGVEMSRTLPTWLRDRFRRQRGPSSTSPP